MERVSPLSVYVNRRRDGAVGAKELAAEIWNTHTHTQRRSCFCSYRLHRSYGTKPRDKACAFKFELRPLGSHRVLTFSAAWEWGSNETTHENAIWRRGSEISLPEETPTSPPLYAQAWRSPKIRLFPIVCEELPGRRSEEIRIITGAWRVSFVSCRR